MFKRLLILSLLTVNLFGSQPNNAGFSVKQQDGKKIIITPDVMAGPAKFPYGFKIKRHNADGSKDNTFQDNAVSLVGAKAEYVKFDQNSNIYVYGSLIDIRNKDPRTADSFVVKFKPNGDTDSSFGDTGSGFIIKTSNPKG